MSSRREKIIQWGCVFKVTFPNNKIYVGSDTAKDARLDFFKYFGSPIKAKADMIRELREYLNGDQPYSLKKEILYSQENVRVGHILEIEQEFISSLNAKDPNIGYNR